ncbi:hypothetical protein BSKO_00355 [Bryopsis sp. KO-2023]|nr:hypothetical protein BSKO_00355 [Bryopsis sp. KO-2023]
MSTKQLPYTEPEYKIAGYTGYIQGLQETYKRTPIPCQIECQEPNDESFIFTRTRTAPRTTPSRDPCNFPETTKKAQPGILWPSLQPSAVQESLRPPRSNITLGDLRIDPFKTSYQVDFDAPHEESKRIRSPMRNEDLAKSEISLKEHYASAFNRVGEERLMKMIARMRERLEAKLANANNNAFKMRKLFKMYDRDQSGLIQLEDFRMMTESFGMQLDDDSLLALYSVYDPEGTAYLRYEQLMSQLLDPDYYSLYIGNVDNTQQHVDAIQTEAMVENMKAKFKKTPEEMHPVFLTVDETENGSLCEKDFCAACAVLGVVLTEKELDYVRQMVTGDGGISYDAFLRLWGNDS